MSETPAVKKINGQFDYIHDPSIRVMVHGVYTHVSNMKLWPAMKNIDFEYILSKKEIDQKLASKKSYSPENYLYAIHVIHHIALHGEDVFREKYITKKLKKLF